MIYKNVLGKHILYFEFLTSTNTKALELLADDKLDEGSVVITDFQEAGKGLDANSWESEKGKNLLMSFLVYPRYIKPEKQFLLNKIVSLAVVDVVREFLPKKELKIKWPNDVYVGDKKICGILINNLIKGNEMTSSVIGVGLNVNQTEFLSDAPNPVSMKNISEKEYDLEAVFVRFCDFLNRRCRGLMQDKERINQDYLSHLYRFGKYALYKIATKEVEARITGIDSYGRLCLETRDARKYTCDLKEVEFII